MAKLLAITANPRRHSHTSRLLQSFLSAYKGVNPADEIMELDLYQMKLPVIDDAVLTAWEKPPEALTPGESALLAEIDQYTQQFLAADKVVFAAPMWNLQFPPALIAYLANIVVAGKSFTYTETGWQGLVADKPFLLIHVRGGVFSTGPAQAFDHAVPYLRSLFNLLGIRDFQTILCEGIEAFPQEAQAIFQQAERQAVDMAKQF